MSNKESQATLNRLIALLRREAENIERLETELAAAKSRFWKLRTEDVPETMRELGVDSMTFESGEKLELYDEVHARIPEESRTAAFAWLQKKGYSTLIKSKLSIAFGMNEYAKMEALAAKLHKEVKRDVLTELSIHPSTLLAFVKERLSEKKDVPPSNLFDISCTRAARIKAARQSPKK